MRFFLDHDVPRHLADVLRRHGHEVELVPEVILPEAGHLLELLGKAGPSGLEGNINFA